MRSPHGWLKDLKLKGRTQNKPDHTIRILLRILWRFSSETHGGRYALLENGKESNPGMKFTSEQGATPRTIVQFLPFPQKACCLYASLVFQKGFLFTELYLRFVKITQALLCNDKHWEVQCCHAAHILQNRINARGHIVVCREPFFNDF